MFFGNSVMLICNLTLYISKVALQGDDSIERILADSSLLQDTMILSFSGASGQLMIYLALSLFDGYYVAIITTTRKIFSVLFSVMWFGHQFSTLQWVGASLVMISAVLELILGKAKKEEQTEGKKSE
jgi:solute carrier family 35 (UDP-galactose transporter), member B1